MHSMVRSTSAARAPTSTNRRWCCDLDDVRPGVAHHGQQRGQRAGPVVELDPQLREAARSGRGPRSMI